MADVGPLEERVDDLLAEILAARTEGRSEDIEALLAENADIADALRERLAALPFVDLALDREVRRSPLPEQIGDYRILREIGRGGMGVVFEALQVSLGRPVALKVLSLAITSTAEGVRRFQREARAAARLHHTNIVPVYGMGQHEGHWYYAMELVRGRPLHRVLEEARQAAGPSGLGASAPSGLVTTTGTGSPSSLSPEVASGSASATAGTTGLEDRAWYARVAGMFAGVADALHVAHGEGVVHRDVKPANLMLTPEGVLKLVDFGLAHLDEEGPTLTREGGALGTPSYMSPEQACGKAGDADFRTDIYSLGATLYEVLTLRAPFRGRTTADILQKVISQDPASPRRLNRRIPRDLQTIVQKAMEKDPARRYATAADFARDLTRFAEGGVIQARRIGVLGRSWRKVRRHKVRSALATAALALVVVTAWLALAARQETRRREALEHADLLAQGQRAMGRSLGRVIDSEFREVLPARGGRADDPRDASPEEAREAATAVDLLTRALAVDPSDPQAWLFRSLAPGRPLAERLADVAEAARQGLEPDTARLADAYLRSRSGKLSQEELDAILAAPPAAADARSAFLLADLQYAAGRPEEALALLGAALSDARRDGAIHHLALRLRALIHRQRNEHALALADLFAIRALGEESPTVAFAIIGVWGRKGDREAADGLLREVLHDARAAEDVTRWRRIVRAARREIGERAYADVVQAAYEAFPGDPHLMTYRAEGLAQEGRPEEARRLIDAAGRLAPDDPLVLALRGRVLGRLGRFEEAVAILKTALAKDGENHQILGLLGLVYLDAERFEESREAYERAHALDRTCPNCLQRLATAYAQCKRLEDAEAAYDRLLRMRPQSALVYAERGAQRWNLTRNREAALADLDKALALAPDMAFARFNRAIVFTQTDRNEEALADFRRARELAPEEVGCWTGTVSALLNLRRDEEALQEAEAAVARFPNDPDAAACRLDVYLVLARHEEAFAAGSEALLRHADDRKVRYQMARIEQARGRLPEALDHIRRSIAVLELPESLTVEAGILEAMGRMDEAILRLERAAALGPWNPQCRYNLARMLLKKEDAQGALRRIDEALALPGTPGIKVDAMGLKARILAGLKWTLEARSLHDQCVQMAPGNPDAWIRRGEFLNNEMKLPAEAEKDFRKALEVDADSAAAWADLGLVLLRQKRPDEATEALANAVRLNPRDRSSTLRLADLHRNSGRPDEAIPLYRAAFGLDPKQVGPLYWISICHQAKDRWQESIAVLDELLAIKVDDPEAHHDRAIALQQLGSYDEALAAYDRASQYGPKWALPWYSRAWVYQKQGRTEDEIAAYRKAIELSPRFSWALNDLGWALEQQGKVEEAIEWYGRAIAADATYLQPLRNRARCWLLRDRPDRALPDSEAAVVLDPKGGYTLYGHADVLWHLGRRDEAIAALEASVQHDPGGRRDSLWRMLLILSETTAYHRWLDLAGRLSAEDPADPVYAGWYVAALRALRRDDDAQAAAREALARPLREGDLGSWAYLQAAAGEAEKARATLEAMDPDRTPGSRRQGSLVSAVLGDREGVKRWLRRYLEEKGPRFPPGARIDPDIERLAEDAEIADLIARMLAQPEPR